MEPREIVDARAEDGKRLLGRRLDPHATTAIADAGGSHRRPTRGCLKLLQLLAERGQRLLRVARLLDRLLRPVHADLIRDVVHRRPVVVESCSVTTTRQVARSVPETGVPLLLSALGMNAFNFQLGRRTAACRARPCGPIFPKTVTTKETDKWFKPKSKPTNQNPILCPFLHFLSVCFKTCLFDGQTGKAFESILPAAE